MPDALQNDKASHVRQRLAGIVTLGALGIALAHLIWPKVAIDGITIALLAIAVVPWLAPLFKTLELPGGWKVEFQEAKELANQAEQVKQIEQVKQPPHPGGEVPKIEKPFENLISWTIDYTDPNLALAGLRIELEKRIRLLALKHGIPSEHAPLLKMLIELADRGVLDTTAFDAFRQTLNILNSAVHGVKIDPRAAEIILTSAGPSLLESLDILNSRPLGSKP